MKGKRPKLEPPMASFHPQFHWLLYAENGWLQYAGK
jgi:hypothetical protein